ncbi:RING-H2 finger protein ATL63-like [Salvia divinorum]|uniref:RING-type E3 ubiquitin transferase n=1 Tax=Salvia divinorum TaxID=28513 RepID=A0ABD1HLA9_SALDI
MDRLTLRSRSVLWSPWTNEDYTRVVTAANRLASSRERIIVQLHPFRLTAAERLHRRFPGSSGLHILVWEVSSAAAAQPLSEYDVLSCFEIRRCDDTDRHEGEVEDCCICLGDLYRGSVTALDCRHEFHSDCIRRWLVRGQNFCPLCKAPAIK